MLWINTEPTAATSFHRIIWFRPMTAFQTSSLGRPLSTSASSFFSSWCVPLWLQRPHLSISYRGPKFKDGARNFFSLLPLHCTPFFCPLTPGYNKRSAGCENWEIKYGSKESWPAGVEPLYSCSSAFPLINASYVDCSRQTFVSPPYDNLQGREIRMIQSENRYLGK